MKKEDLFSNIKENLFIAFIAIFVIILFYFIFDSQLLKETNEEINYTSFSGGLEENSDIIINNFKIFIENTELYNLSLSYGSEMNALLEEYQNDLKNKVGILDLGELFPEDKDSKNKEKIFALISKLNLLKDFSKNQLIKRDVIIKKYSDLENTFNAIGVNILHKDENIVFSSQELFINTAIDFYTYLLSIQDWVVMENGVFTGIKGENNGKKYNDFVELLNKNYKTYEQNYNNLIKSKSLYQELIENI